MSIMETIFRPIPDKLKGYSINRYGLVKNDKGRLLKPQIRHDLCYYQLHKEGEVSYKAVKTFAKKAKVKLIVNPDKDWGEKIITFVDRYNQLLKERKVRKKLESFRYIEPENRPNGKTCVDCGKDLWDGWYRRCPTCWDRISPGEEENE